MHDILNFVASLQHVDWPVTSVVVIVTNRIAHSINCWHCIYSYVQKFTRTVAVMEQ